MTSTDWFTLVCHDFCSISGCPTHPTLAVLDPRFIRPLTAFIMLIIAPPSFVMTWRSFGVRSWGYLLNGAMPEAFRHMFPSDVQAALCLIRGVLVRSQFICLCL